MVRYNSSTHDPVSHVNLVFGHHKSLSIQRLLDKPTAIDIVRARATFDRLFFDSIYSIGTTLSCWLGDTPAFPYRIQASCFTTFSYFSDASQPAGTRTDPAQDHIDAISQVALLISRAVENLSMQRCMSLHGVKSATLVAIIRC